jgi:hypothetical protein
VTKHRPEESTPLEEAWKKMLREWIQAATERDVPAEVKAAILDILHHFSLYEGSSTSTRSSR